MRLSVLLMALTLSTAWSAKATPINFSSTAAMQSTCLTLRPQTPAQLRRDDIKVAYVICSGLDLITDTARWARTNFGTGRMEDPQIWQRVRAKLEEILGKLKTARMLLESVHATKPLFTIQPGEWSIDLDGDGIVTPFEKHFFWVANRGSDQIAAFSGISSSSDYYEKNFIRPIIKLDQSDVYWAAAYLNFAEGALNLLLSYDFDPKQKEPVFLRDGKRVAAIAYPRFLAGIATSRKLHESLLEETDDDYEWIANPKQVNSVFPLVLDAQSFATWRALLEHMDKLFRGKTLLGGATPASSAGDARAWRMVDLTLGLCKPGEGINVRDLFLRPLQQPGNAAARAARCVKPTASTPFTGLGTLLEESLRRNAGRTPANSSGEWMVLRHLYWVN